jgi:hypothetical protein
MSDKKSAKKAEWAANWIGNGFLLAARRLREVQDENPHLFPVVAKFLNIGLRRAYYFARIDRTFRELEVDDDRLTAIGWTKLKLLADYIDGDNCEYLLDMAEKSTVRELSLIVRREVPQPGTRCITLYLTPDQYEVFSGAVTANGAVKVGGGLANKEKALINALSSSDD